MQLLHSGLCLTSNTDRPSSPHITIALFCSYHCHWFSSVSLSS